MTYMKGLRSLYCSFIHIPLNYGNFVNEAEPSATCSFAGILYTFNTCNKTLYLK